MTISYSDEQTEFKYLPKFLRCSGRLVRQCRISIQEGWCDSAGSLYRKAGSRQLATSSGYEPDKSNWGWKWLERWMVVRPWENHFLDINQRDGVAIQDTEAGDRKKDILRKFSAKKAIPLRTDSNTTSEKMGLSNFVGCNSSPTRSSDCNFYWIICWLGVG